MATPITHILLAKKIQKKYFPDKDEAEYLVGTSFPDIRYLGVIERSKTHHYGYSIAQIKSLTPFEAGVKVHALVDEIREDYVKENGTYTLIPDNPYAMQATKWFEDILFYDRFNDWKKVASCFKKIYPESLRYGIEEGKIKMWQNYLNWYFLRKPDSESMYKYIDMIGRPKEMADSLLLLIEEIKKEKKFTQLANDMYDNFEKLVEKYE